MNTKQLKYIKDKRKRGIFVVPTVTMRTTIDNSIIEELDTIYNPIIAGMETEYKSSLNDISLPHDFLENTYMISTIRKYGSGVIMMYMYLHAKMCVDGYKMVWNEIQQDIVKVALAGMYKMDINTIGEIIKALLEAKLLYLISDSEEQYLTSVYQIFIYERVSAKRLRDRVYKKNVGIKQKGNKYKIETQLPAFEEEQEIAEEIAYTEEEMENAMNAMIQEEIEEQKQIQQAEEESDTVIEGWIDTEEDIPFK